MTALSKAAPCLLLGLSTMMVLQGCGDGVADMTDSKCPTSHYSPVCLAKNSAGSFVNDADCCAAANAGSCGTENPGVDGQEYVNFGYGAPDYEKVCGTGTDQYYTCCIKWNEFAYTFCGIDAEMYTRPGSSESGASNGQDGRAGSSICLEKDAGGAEVANLDCMAPQGKGSCAAGYTFTEGKQAGKQSDGAAVHATCCVPGNATRLLSDDLLA